MSIDAPYLRQTLLEAAQENDIEGIMKTLESGTSIENLINSVDPATGFTSLHHACSNGNVELTCFLLRHGAMINICDHYNKTPMHYACHFGFTEVVFILLDSDLLDLNEFYTQNKAKLTCLQTAAARGHTAILNLLLLHGDVVDGVNDLGETAMHHAAAANFLEAVQLLLHCGANPMATTRQGDTPLHYACRDNAMDTAKFIVKWGVSIHLNNFDNPPRSCLEMARVFGHSVLANVILEESKRNRDEAVQIEMAHLKKSISALDDAKTAYFLAKQESNRKKKIARREEKCDEMKAIGQYLRDMKNGKSIDCALSIAQRFSHLGLH